MTEGGQGLGVEEMRGDSFPLPCTQERGLG